MNDVPLGLAVAAGSVAALNPCGFALLPAYLSLLVGGDDMPSGARAVRRALTAALAMTVGFTLVFAGFGLALAPVAAVAARYLPWFTAVLGLLLVALGGWLLAGRSMPGLRRFGGTSPITGSVVSLMGYGAAYALASLSCTVGPFLAIVVSSFRAGSVLGGIALFLAYAAGMGLVVGVAALAVALAQPSVVGRLRRSAAVMSRIGGLIVLLSGAYVAYYGWYDLRVLRGGDPNDPVVTAAVSVQGWLADGVARVGWLWLAVVLTVLVIGGTLLGRRPRSGPEPIDARP